MTYENDPRMITAKFNSVCSKCGCSIKKGTQIYYWPSDRKAFCVSFISKNINTKQIAP
jgi:hypothetical protein